LKKLLLVILLLATPVLAVNVNDILTLAEPPPYQVSPQEMEAKYKTLVKMEIPHMEGKHQYKVTSFHNHTTTVIEKDGDWEQTIIIKHKIHRTPVAWIKWKWVEGVHPMFGTMGYYQPESCWEKMGKSYRQVYGEKNEI